MENDQTTIVAGAGAAAASEGPSSGIGLDESIASTSTMDINIARLNQMPNESMMFLDQSSRSGDITPFLPTDDDMDVAKDAGGGKKKKSSSKKSKKSSKSGGSKKSKKSISGMSTTSSAAGSKATSSTTKGGRRTKPATPKSMNVLDPNTLLVGQVSEDIYVVEKICDMKDFGGVMKYWVKWQGWGVAHNTWEPIENLDGCTELLKKFHESLKSKQGGKAGKESKAKKKRVEDTVPVDDNLIQDEEESTIPIITIDQEIPSTSAAAASPVATTSSTRDRIRKRVADAESDDDDMLRLGRDGIRIHSVWPTSKVPKKVLTVQVVDRKLCYLVWCYPQANKNNEDVQKAASGSGDNSGAANEFIINIDLNDLIIIRGAVFRKIFPHLLISFYEARFQWLTGSSDDDELAKKAAMNINQKMNLEKLEKEEKLREAADGDAGGVDKEEADKKQSMLNEALNEIKMKAKISDSELISNEEKMELGSDDEVKMKSDSSDEDEVPAIRVRPVTDKEIFDDEFGLPADMSSSEDENGKLSTMGDEDSESDEDDYREVTIGRFMEKVESAVSDQVTV